MTDLILVRHGRTEANASGLLLGRLDPDLDELGREQATALAGAVEQLGSPIGAVVSSPLKRALQTASAFETSIEVDDRFVELDYGELDGVPITDVPSELWALWRSDIHFAPPGGESLAHLGTRVRDACEDWASRGIDGSVVVVSHVSPIKAAVAWALGGGDEMGWRTRLDPASITHIATEVGPRGVHPVLRSFNERNHLAGL